MFFHHRREAGQLLAKALAEYRDSDAIVYALPRGGVVLGKEVAHALHAPLDLLIPRKIGHPANPEYAIAAVTETGEVVRNETAVAAVNAQWFVEEIARQRKEAARRRTRYLPHGAPHNAEGKTAIIVDDGIATGLTMRAALNDLRQRNPARIVIAVPVAPRDTVAQFRTQVDDVIALHAPEIFGSVGAYYYSFDQVSDEEVENLMQTSVASA